jgi:hypothetical protein
MYRDYSSQLQRKQQTFMPFIEMRKFAWICTRQKLVGIEQIVAGGFLERIGTQNP